MRKAISSFRNRLLEFVSRFQSDRWLLTMFIFGAGLVWFFAKMSNQFTLSHSIPVRYQVPEQLAISDAAPANVAVTIRASGWSLLSGGFVETFKNLSLAAKNKGQNIFKKEQLLAQLRTAVCPDCVITEIQPSEIQLNLEPALIREVPVRLPLIRHFVKGVFPSGQVTLTPARVRIHGPASKVSDLTFWLADTLQISDVEGDIHQAIVMPEHLGSITLLDTQRVVVHAPAEPFTEKKIVANIATRGLRDGVTHFPAKVTLSFLAPLSQYKNLRAEDFTVLADFTNIERRNSNFLPISVVKQPAFIKNLKISPPNLRFYYQAQ